MFSYRPSFIPNKIMIIGCGGTGSRLVPLLAQFVKTCAWVPDPEMVLIDDDIVEEKNLFRQNFITPDVGKPKAEVLASRYARAFNMNINAFKTRVTGYKDFSKDVGRSTCKNQEVLNTFNRYRYNAIIVLCVDSPQARRDILETLMGLGVGYQNNVLLLDSGNENDFGQVSLSTMSVPTYAQYCGILELPKAIPGDVEITGIPMDVGYFRDMQAVSTPSCADLDQTMAINTMMAVTMFGIIQNMYYAKPISYHRINISLSHGSTPQYMNTDFIKDTARRGNDKFQELYLPTFDVGTPIQKFYNDVYKPMQEAIKKAEKEKLAAEKKKLKAKEDAMRKAEGLEPIEPLQVKTKEAEGLEALSVVARAIAGVVPKVVYTDTISGIIQEAYYMDASSVA